MATSINNNNMEIDMNISDILREVVTFLECLCDVKLPLKLESLREELLTRAKTATRASSPDRPYLDMNSGPKSLLLIKDEADSEDYVGMEGSQREKQSHQDYYETCEGNQGNATPPSATMAKSPERHTTTDRDPDPGQEAQKLLAIYKSLSATQSRNKCHKCGPLYKKEGKKLFLSENRACWIALVGSHLLIYRSERHNRPYAIHSIRGYMARAAPNLIPRDRQKKDSAFEIYKPGNETLQFIARTPKDMDQWIAKVYEVGGFGKENANSDVEIPETRSSVQNESSAWTSADQRAGNDNKETTSRHARGATTTGHEPVTTNKSTKSSKDENQSRDEKRKRERNTAEDPPPLPSRIPRRLPSLPPDSASYRVDVEDDDDDDEIYHKIEDLINGTCYQNLALRRRRDVDEQQNSVSYDDVHGSNEKDGKRIQVPKPVHDSMTSQEETYDDVGMRSNGTNPARTVHRDKQNGNGTITEERREEFYDDVKNVIATEKLGKDRAKDQTDAPQGKSPQKKSFLGRVLSRKESSAKSLEKKYKGKVSSASNTPSSSAVAEVEEMPAYDDVSDLTANQESPTNGEELPEYNCPPPPRPVYASRLSPVANNPDDQIEEIYDDVNTCREQYKKTHRQETSPQSTQESKEVKSDACNVVLDAGTNDERLSEVTEHYQSPKSELRVCVIQQEEEEELYDDIALLTDFKARQRHMAEQEDNRSASSPDKKSWNRFNVNRRSRTSDASSACAEPTNRRGNDCDDAEDTFDKKNTFKKLISKVENSLRVSTRNPASSLAGIKSSAAQNNF